MMMMTGTRKRKVIMESIKAGQKEKAIKRKIKTETKTTINIETMSNKNPGSPGFFISIICNS